MKFETVVDFLNYVNSIKDDPSKDLDITLKRSCYRVFGFSEHNGKLHYLKDDGVGSGLIKPLSIHRVFNIKEI